MRPTIALAINLPLPEDLESFDSNKWLGSQWIKEFKKIADDLNFTVKRAQDVDAKKENVYLVQEDMCNYGEHLVNATCAVTYNLESVMYAKEWYDKRSELKNKFEFLLEFGDGELYFPSYSLEDVVEFDLKPREKFVCMIMSNKHYRGFGITPPISQLHDYRYQVIEWAKKNYNMDLYGFGWPDGYGIAVENKFEILKQYKYTIVIENDAKPGYFTEKYLHAMVNGCIPIYLGDPNFNPVLDASPGRIQDSLDMAIKMTQGARDTIKYSWLKQQGDKYTYKHFAKTIMNKVLQC